MRCEEWLKEKLNDGELHLREDIRAAARKEGGLPGGIERSEKSVRRKDVPSVR